MTTRINGLLAGRDDIVAGLLVAAYSVVMGGVVGAFWQAHASRIMLGTATSGTGAVNGSEGAMKALLDDDMQFAVIGIVAGLLITVTLLAVCRGRVIGPGAVVGLAVGGLLGSIVAAHVGGMAQHDAFAAAVRHGFPGATSGGIATLRGYFGFRIRARVVVLAWPIAAVVVYGLAAAVRSRTP